MIPEVTLKFCEVHREDRETDAIYFTTLSIATFIQREQYINKREYGSGPNRNSQRKAYCCPTRSTI